MIQITSLDDPRLDVYRNQRDAWLAASHNPGQRRGAAGAATETGSGLFMAEGGLVIQSLLRSRYRLDSILATPERYETIALEVEQRAPEAPVYLAPRALLEQVLGFDLHRGLLAAGRRLAPRAAGDVIASARVLILAEDLSNHDNVGGLFRTVAALIGPTAGILLSPRCCDPLYRKALRVSIGHALAIPFATLEPWPAGLERVVSAGFRILALTPAGSVPACRHKMDAADRIALLIGAEGPGLSPQTLAELGPRVEPVCIPMQAGVDSLNVVVATAIVLDRVAERVVRGGGGGGSPGDQLDV